MKQALSDVAKAFIESEDGQQAIVAYNELKKHPGWKAHQGFLVTMGSMLANIPISRRFQELPDNEKLIQLAAYSKVNEVIKFLLDPIPGMQRHIKLKEATRRGATKRGKKNEREKAT